VGKEKGATKHDHPTLRPFRKLPAKPQFDHASAMFRALGDPFRLRLLARLANGEVTVTELAQLENEKLTTISARLKTLYAVRLVKRRREAKHIFYSLSDSHVLQLMQNAMEHATERDDI
jgi:DNA-binding transcriptional ArsR family regulator